MELPGTLSGACNRFSTPTQNFPVIFWLSGTYLRQPMSRISTKNDRHCFQQRLGHHRCFWTICTLLYLLLVLTTCLKVILKYPGNHSSNYLIHVVSAVAPNASSPIDSRICICSQVRNFGMCKSSSVILQMVSLLISNLQDNAPTRRRRKHVNSIGIRFTYEWIQELLHLDRPQPIHTSP